MENPISRTYTTHKNEKKMTKSKKLLTILITASVATLAGCANESAREVNLNLKYITANSAPIKTNNEHAQAQIAEASTSIGHSLQQLSAIQMAQHPGIKLPKANNSKGLSHLASLNWNGPIEPVVSHIAAAAGYHFQVLGRKPAIPVIININSDHQTLGSILRNITLQAQPTATIKIYSSQQIIELRYH